MAGGQDIFNQTTRNNLITYENKNCRSSRWLHNWLFAGL